MSEELIQLASQIKDSELANSVTAFLKDLRLSHSDFGKYPKTEIDECTTTFVTNSPFGEIVVERDVLRHTIALVDLCVRCADTLERVYGVAVNRDYLMAAGILHDTMKIFEWKKEKGHARHTGILLDHTMLAVAELYHRGFPEEIIHMIASHFGPRGPTPPRTIEAQILHYLDTVLSVLESQIYSEIRQAEYLAAQPSLEVREATDVIEGKDSSRSKENVSA